MAVSDSYLDFLQDQLQELGPIRVKRMFGGASLYCHEVIFALVDDDVLYLKANEATQDTFISHGMPPFTYVAKGKQMQMAYWQVPEEIIHDADTLVEWSKIALSVAVSNQKSKKPKLPKKESEKSTSKK